MKILVIDDDEGNLLNLRDLLELNGHDVRIAGDGLEGVRQAAERPDLIFCDVDMPGMNGYQAISAIQQLPHCHDVPFIFLTGRVERDDQRQGMNLGADDYITKPFRGSDILGAIEARIRRQRPLRDRIRQLVEERQQEASADWSHELLTPLNAVLGGLELIESAVDTIKPDELKELLGLVRAGAERQRKLSGKLIRYFSLERRGAPPPGAAKSCRADVAVAEGAGRVAKEEKRERDLSLNCAAAVADVPGPAVADAVAELVENAFHFSPAGAEVMVTGRCSGAAYCVEVLDAGPGMTPAQRANTRPFVQHGRQRREQQGLGLGLAIARASMEWAGGSLRLDEGADGQGLRAVLEFPLAGAGPARGSEASR